MEISIRMHDALSHCNDDSNTVGDGEEEDVNSPGNSPHKTHLLARRRWAEAQVKDAGGDAPPESVDEGMLVRTFTERARESTGPAALGRGSSRAKSILADKLNEVMQLKRELAARPVDAVIPRPKRRTSTGSAAA